MMNSSPPISDRIPMLFFQKKQTLVEAPAKNDNGDDQEVVWPGLVEKEDNFGADNGGKNEEEDIAFTSINEFGSPDKLVRREMQFEKKIAARSAIDNQPVSSEAEQFQTIPTEQQINSTSFELQSRSDPNRPKSILRKENSKYKFVAKKKILFLGSSYSMNMGEMQNIPEGGTDNGRKARCSKFLMNQGKLRLEKVDEEIKEDEEEKQDNDEALPFGPNVKKVIFRDQSGKGMEIS